LSGAAVIDGVAAMQDERMSWKDVHAAGAAELPPPPPPVLVAVAVVVVPESRVVLVTVVVGELPPPAPAAQTGISEAQATASSLNSVEGQLRLVHGIC
jgi:hypothetical protein